MACLGDDFNESFLKALLSVGFRMPIRTMLLSTGPPVSKVELLDAVRRFERLGVRFYVTGGTRTSLADAGIETELLHRPLDDRQPGAVEAIREGTIDLVINIPKNDTAEELTNGYTIRRAAVDYNVPLITDRQLVMRLAEALSQVGIEDLQIKSLAEYFVPAAG